MRSAVRWSVLLATVMAIGVMIAPIGSARAYAADLNAFEFESLDVDYTLTRAEDGTASLEVVETFVAVFPENQNRGIRRSLVTTYNGQPTHPTVLSITDENGNERPLESETDDGWLEVTSRADGYLDGRQTFVITYTMQNVVWDFDDTGLEFYWDVNGTGWAQPFGEITARVHLPADLADELTGDTACYAGAQNASTECAGITQQEDAEGGVTITATARDVQPYQTLTLAVGFSEGAFSLFNAGYFGSAWGWLQLLAIAGLLVVAVWGVVRRARWGSDAPGRPTIIAEYSPPPNYDALRSAVFLGRRSKAIPAEVVEQAVTGSIRIVEGEKGWFGKAPLIAELVDRSLADDNGKQLLDGLFTGPRRRSDAPGQYTFGRSDTRFSKMAERLLHRTRERQRNLRRAVPGEVRTVPMLAVMALAAASLFLGILGVVNYVHPVVPIVLGIASIVVALAVVVYLLLRPLTEEGAELRDHLEGLRIFIGWAEADRIRTLQSPQGAERRRIDVNDPREMLHLYETLLPFAIVFGQEKEWARSLAIRYSDAGVASPTWYAGTGAFSAESFASSVGSLSASAATSSSTSGGSSGGGGAGGGGGGGGGGGV